MISYSGLRRGIKIIMDGQPYEILEASPMFKGRGSSVLQAKIKNLINGNVLSRNFRPGEEFEEAEIIKIRIRFLYFHRDKFVFCDEQKPSLRFEFSKEIVGENNRFLKTNEAVDGIELDGKIINISLPVKVNLKVIESPPGTKGDRSQAGNKQITLETKTKINAPLFIKEGDIVEVNTETGEYVRRIE